jgi:hypothetical protein
MTVTFTNTGESIMSVTIDTTSKIRHDGLEWVATGEFRPAEYGEAYLNASSCYSLVICKKNRMSQSRPIFRPHTENLTEEVLQRFENGNLDPYVKSGYMTMDSDGTFFWHKNKPNYHDSCGKWYSKAESCEIAETNWYKHKEPAIYLRDEDYPELLEQEIKYIDASQMCFKI